jgi:saccharopine dehydrogenase-like NADP-dependent oxidoreductase
MKLLILGGGLMGPAAAFNAMLKPDVSQVIIGDMSQPRLEHSLAKLAGKPGADKLGVVRLDLNDQAAATRLLTNFDAVLAALPRTASPLAIRAALQAGTPLVDLTMPPHDRLPALQELARSTGGLVILACGLEPGLTEILARHLAEKLDRVDELHIKCGGIPARPSPPLGYKIVFGGQQLPLHDSDARLVDNGQLKPVPRYSGVEPVTFPGVGQCEAWHEGFMPWLLDLPILKNLRAGTQKTVRWPGYAAKVTILKEMGLLSQQPVRVNGVEVIPKKLLDTLLYPQVKLADGERDIAVIRVEVLGQRAGRPGRLQAQMVDGYDEAWGFTAMARTTAFTGAIVAHMIAQGKIQARGLIHPEQVITGPLFDQLLVELAAHNIKFEITTDDLSAYTS